VRHSVGLDPHEHAQAATRAVGRSQSFAPLDVHAEERRETHAQRLDVEQRVAVREQGIGSKRRRRHAGRLST
jgi:hypothetical protein